MIERMRWLAGSVKRRNRRIHEPKSFTLPPPHDPSEGLPYWFLRLSPLSMDALKGPDDQYCDGARDMLAVIRSGKVSINEVLGEQPALW